MNISNKLWRCKTGFITIFGMEECYEKSIDNCIGSHTKSYGN